MTTDATSTTASALGALLTVRETASAVRVTGATLFNWRQQGVGPEWVRVGRGIRYPEQALREWLTRNAGGTA